MKRSWLKISVLGLLAACACLSLDPLFFDPEPATAYRWDDTAPCDPQLEGELAHARHERLGGPEPTCHASRVPAEQRLEGFVEAAGNSIHYLYAYRNDARATILYSHGNSTHIGYYWERVELMWQWGFNVVIYDYPGYGRSSGKPNEAAIYAAAAAVLELMPTLPGLDSSRVFLMGYSLGGAPTIEMALRATRGETPLVPRGVITEAAFCSTEALIQDGSYTNLSVGFLSNNPFDNCAKIGRVAQHYPVSIIHGEEDDFVVARHAQFLLDASHDRATLLLAPGAKHIDIPLVAARDYQAWLTDFFSR